MEKNTKFYRREKSKDLNRSPYINFFFFLIVILMSISFISPFEFDNVKDYNSDTKTATIKNAFGLGDTIAEIKLNTPHINYVLRGEDKLVAEFTIDNKGNYDNVFNSLDFYYINDNMRKFNRGYDYKYKTYEDYEIPNYVEECKYSEVNKTEECNTIQKGTQTLQKPIWNEFNSKTQLEKGIITIGIFTDVYPGDSVEWIPELFGVKIPEWAIWEESFNTDITSYFDFNGTGTNLPNLVNASNNGTGSGAVNWTTDGLIGNASGFDGNYYIGVSDTVWDNSSDAVSISLWFQQTVTGTSDIINTDSVPTDNNFGIAVDASNDMRVYAGDGDTGHYLALDDNWRHVVVTIEPSNQARIYVNGTLSTNFSIGAPFIENKGLKIGSDRTGGDKFQGNIDELGVWERLLTDAEITDLYNSGAGLTYIGEFPISVTLDNPTNNSEFLAKTIGFTANHSTTTSTLKNTTLKVWNSTGGLYLSNETNITGTTNTTNLSLAITINDTYHWNFYSCTLVECGYATNNRTLTATHIKTNSETYENVTTEGNLEDFEINLTTSGSQITVANLIYNSTAYAGTLNIDGVNYRITREIEVPLVTTEEEVDLYWQLRLANGYTLNTTTRTQNITNIGIDNCSSYGFLIANFTLKDEDSQTTLIPAATFNTSIKIDLDLFTVGSTEPIINYSNDYNYTNPAQICLSQINSSEYEMNLIVEYSSKDRFTEFYNIKNYSLTNSTLGQNISLYDLNSTKGQEFKLTYKDSNFNTVPDALVQVQRQYVDEGVFKTIEIPKISSAGYTMVHLIRNDAVYNLIIIKDGVVLDSFDNIVANCQTPTLKDCEININSLASTVSPEDFDLDGDFSSTLTYNETTRVISSTFAITSGSSAVTTLNATLFNAFGNTTICSDSLDSAGGTLSCTVPTSYQNSTVIIKINSGGEEKRRAILRLDSEPSEIYGTSLMFLGLMIIVLIIGMSITDNPTMLGIMLIVGVIVLTVLNITSSVGWIGAGATILWFIIAVIIILIKGGNRQ